MLLCHQINLIFWDLWILISHVQSYLHLTGQILTVCVQSSVLPAPGDLLRRDGPGLFPVRFVEAERRWVDFSTLHSGETTHSGSPLNALPFLYQQTCSLFSEFLWHELNKQLYRQYGPGNATYVESLSGSVVTHDYGVTETVKKT